MTRYTEDDCEDLDDDPVLLFPRGSILYRGEWYDREYGPIGVDGVWEGTDDEDKE